MYWSKNTIWISFRWNFTPLISKRIRKTHLRRIWKSCAGVGGACSVLGYVLKTKTSHFPRKDGHWASWSKLAWSHCSGCGCWDRLAVGDVWQVCSAGAGCFSGGGSGWTLEVPKSGQDQPLSLLLMIIMIIQHPSSVIYYSSSIIHYPSSISCPSSIIHRPSSRISSRWLPLKPQDWAIFCEKLWRRMLPMSRSTLESANAGRLFLKPTPKKLERERYFFCLFYMQQSSIIFLTF